MLIERTRQCTPVLRQAHRYLDEVLTPGNVIVTSNWDVLLERYAKLQRIPLRLTGTGDDEEVVLLKLHGSIDWCLGRHMTWAASTSDYAMLNERLNPSRSYTPSLPGKRERQDLPLRIRALENWSSGWRVLRSRASEPQMVTMARGKAGDLGPLRSVWRDAYGAISRARRLELVGYSMPPDDIEIRTLLRAGVQRGKPLDEVFVRNPAPEVHARVRQFLDRTVTSEYRGVHAT